MTWWQVGAEHKRSWAQYKRPCPFYFSLLLVCCLPCFHSQRQHAVVLPWGQQVPASEVQPASAPTPMPACLPCCSEQALLRHHRSQAPVHRRQHGQQNHWCVAVPAWLCMAACAGGAACPALPLSVPLCTPYCRPCCPPLLCVCCAAGRLGFEPLTLHRLDMNTTGAVLFAKQRDIVDGVHSQFRWVGGAGRRAVAPRGRGAGGWGAWLAHTQQLLCLAGWLPGGATPVRLLADACCALLPALPCLPAGARL